VDSRVDSGVEFDIIENQDGEGLGCLPYLTLPYLILPYLPFSLERYIRKG